MTEDRPGVAALAALADPQRRAVYDVVCRRDEPTSRDEAAAELGMSRRAAAFHLDELAAKGLLDVEFRRLTGRSGPGAGRPAKLYRRADDEVSVSVPDRRYDLAGEILAAAVDAATQDGIPLADAVRAAAQDAGRRLGSGRTDADAVLVEQGFEPRPDADGSVVLANCPFHRLARSHTNVVCGLNVDLLGGVLTACGDPRRAVLDPAPGRCCVRVGPP